MLSRYINPYTDFGFKKLFGEEANKDLLIDFLNAVLPENYRIAELTFSNTEQLPDNNVNRKAIFDIACISSKGEHFVVEMQKAKQLYFKDRALFDLSYPIQRQAQKGDWDFKLNPVFLVAVLDFIYDEVEERRKLRRLVTLKDQDGEEFSKNLQMVFLQMPLFALRENQLKTPFDKWMYFLKNLESFDDIPSILREPVFEKAFATAEHVRFPPQLQEAYRKDLMAYWDNTNVMNTAIMEGEARGEAKGKAERAIEIARNLKRMGLSAADIAKATGLSLDEAERL
ncbi:hypothetical protein FACS189443_6350 [Planctomycetales bacterium]|nr:hypothetical protein FACS189443_6350 [Planctomycetales bacterium]